MEGKFVILLVITALCVEQCLTSSIPMFEFLSRDEKVSKLNFYFIFNLINTERLKLRKKLLKLKLNRVRIFMSCKRMSANFDATYLLKINFG